MTTFIIYQSVSMIVDGVKYMTTYYYHTLECCSGPFIMIEYNKCMNATPTQWNTEMPEWDIHEIESLPFSLNIVLTCVNRLIVLENILAANINACRGMICNHLCQHEAVSSFGLAGMDY